MQGMATPMGVIFTDMPVNIRLESGESDTYKVESTWNNPNHSVIGVTFGLPPTFCVGRIRYKDEGGIIRETGFCRKYELVNNEWFIPSPIPEYEYAY